MEAFSGESSSARSSLMTAPHSTPENSDIQILPEGRRAGDRLDRPMSDGGSMGSWEVNSK